MRIYLAGPFFNDKQNETISRIEDEFDKHGLNYFSPRKSGGVIAHLSPEDKLKESKRIYDKNVEEMVSAHILFAIVDGRDTGTVYEMGYFKALRDHADHKRYSITYTNENFGLNIMLKESVDAHVVGVNDLITFTGLLSAYWENTGDLAPAMKDGIDWQDHIGRRQKILEQFQNFNPDVE